MLLLKAPFSNSCKCCQCKNHYTFLTASALFYCAKTIADWPISVFGFVFSHTVKCPHAVQLISTWIAIGWRALSSCTSGITMEWGGGRDPYHFQRNKTFLLRVMYWGKEVIFLNTRCKPLGLLLLHNCSLQLSNSLTKYLVTDVLWKKRTCKHLHKPLSYEHLPC